MTDGIIPKNVPAQVAKLNAEVRPKNLINSILFGGGVGACGPTRRPVGRPASVSGEEQLKKLAADSAGTYRFVSDAAERPAPGERQADRLR